MFISLLIVVVVFLSPFTNQLDGGVGKPKPDSSVATLLEAREYSPCDYTCAPFNHPTTAYCFSLGDKIVVGERGSLLGENDTASMRNAVGQEFSMSSDNDSIWVSRAGQSKLRIKSGSAFEGVKSTRCIAKVHMQKLTLASSSKRPATVPDDAFALAAARPGEVQPFFRWFECKTSDDLTTITCKKWSPNGELNGVDRYCARTLQGEPVSASFDVDRLASREGQLVLKTGSIVERDDRGRMNDKLMRPEEVCYQFGQKH
jgi:hypothetical protein